MILTIILLTSLWWLGFVRSNLIARKAFCNFSYSDWDAVDTVVIGALALSGPIFWIILLFLENESAWHPKTWDIQIVRINGNQK